MEYKKRDFEVGDKVLLKEDLGSNKKPISRVLKIEPDSNGSVRSVDLPIVDSLNNQKLLRRSINEIVVLLENEMARFPAEETKKDQDDMIT